MKALGDFQIKAKYRYYLLRLQRIGNAEIFFVHKLQKSYTQLIRLGNERRSANKSK